MIPKLVIMFLFVLYAAMVGISDGFLWHANVLGKDTVFTKAQNRFLHAIFWLTRVVFTISLSINIYFLVFAAFSFSFIHNGMYYETRNYLNPKVYPLGFFDNSTTDQSLTGRFFTVTVRIWMLAIGLLSALFY